MPAFMQRRYATADVFTGQMFGGDPVAAEHRWRVHQGVERGRPSVLLGRTMRDERGAMRDGRGAVTVYVGG